MENPWLTMENPWKIHGKSTQPMDDLGLPPFILKRRSLRSSEAATEPWLHLQHHLRAWKAQREKPPETKLRNKTCSAARNA